MKLIKQSLVLISSFILVFFWQRSFLSQYTVPALGFLIFLYLLTFVRKKGGIDIKGGPLAIFSLNTVILLLVFSTGSLSSSLFFLLYFLGFGISFVFEPQTVFVFILGGVAIFIPEALVNNATENFVKLGSLVLISPLAYFFGKEYRERDSEEEKTSFAADKISSDVGEILKRDQKKLDSKDVERLNDILEETENLHRESKES